MNMYMPMFIYLYIYVRAPRCQTVLLTSIILGIRRFRAGFKCSFASWKGWDKSFVQPLNKMEVPAGLNECKNGCIV